MNDLKTTLTGAKHHATASITYGVPEDGDTVVVNGITCTYVPSAPGANEFSNIEELEALCEAISNINSSENGTTVTLQADAVGTAGNAYTLSLGGGNTGTMEISGATFLGGADAIYSDTFNIADASEFDVIITVTALGGTTPTVDCTPEGSYDGGSTWVTLEDNSENALTMTQLTAAGHDKQNVTSPAPLNRLKIVLGGTSPTITGSVYFNPRKA